jgi:hypothetical protein
MATKLRKTIDVATIKDKANIALAVESEGNTPDFRRGIFTMLESILMDTGNYKGFQYTNLTPEMKNEEGYLLPGEPKDDTRRRYY